MYQPLGIYQINNKQRHETELFILSKIEHSVFAISVDKYYLFHEFETTVTH